MSKSDNFDTDIDIDQEPGQESGQEQEQSQEEQISEEPEPRKPKGGLLVKGIIALAVAGGIGFYFLKPSGEMPLTDTAMPVAQPGQQAMATAIATTPPPSTPLPAAVPESRQDTVPVAMPAPEDMPPEAKLLDAPAMPAAAAPVNSANEDPLAWGGAAAKPSASPALPALEPSSAPVMPAAETQPAPAMPAATAAVASKPAPDQEIPKVSGAPQEKIDTLEKRLTALEETISSLQAKALTRTDIESLELAVGKMQQEAEKAKVEAEEKARAEEAAKAVKTKAKAKVAKTKVKKTKTASVSRKAQPASNWVLKSAKPGMAWVAEKGSSELNTVSVGGTLRGIGKITSIEKDSAGRWVVGGTEGKISQ